ncbi:hypothetical protein VNO80_22795 [Phaseolus coccineus]|uniref:Uncharacterized protein n=1 Tax=Phaseolus coccineus TaxID=3886 RepID=A0AAN9QUM0_PHACN
MSILGSHATTGTMILRVRMLASVALLLIFLFQILSAESNTFLERAYGVTNSSVMTLQLGWKSWLLENSTIVLLLENGSIYSYIPSVDFNDCVIL